MKATLVINNPFFFAECVISNAVMRMASNVQGPSPATASCLGFNPNSSCWLFSRACCLDCTHCQMTSYSSELNATKWASLHVSSSFDYASCESQVSCLPFTWCGIYRCTESSPRMTYSPPTLTGAGYQRTIPTSKGHFQEWFNQWEH